MAFNIRMGVPEMEAQWNALASRQREGRLDKAEERFFKKLVKVLGYLRCFLVEDVAICAVDQEFYARWHEFPADIHML